jgi:pectate lyase
MGPGDSAFQYNITFHHNFYNDCGSRMPLLRQSNVHMYNNYYYSGNNCQDIRANAFAYSEYNYFEDCNNAQIIKVTDTYQGTIIKSFNDVHNNSTKTQATVVTLRDASLTGLCKPDGTTTDYTNFDTNTLLFYYDAVNKKSNVTYMSSAEDAKQDCIAYAGAGTLFNRLK